MAKGKIKVITDVPPKNRQKGKKYEPTILEIDADVYGNLGIHRPFHLDDGQIIYAKHGWQVTENNSGQRQVTWGTKAECVAYCKEFNRIAATTGVGVSGCIAPSWGVATGKLMRLIDKPITRRFGSSRRLRKLRNEESCKA